jgi:hypothetical protein
MFMPETIARKYVLTKIAKGDYLLPSNDGGTLWRIRSYEDGPSYGLEDWPRDLTLWGIWKWDTPVTGASLASVDPDAWDRWECYDTSYESRAQAIRSVLRCRQSELTWGDGGLRKRVAEHNAMTTHV